MPVPRQLSSSCGTCVRFTLPETQISGNDDSLLPFSEFPEMEQLATPEEEEYRQIWRTSR